MPDFKKFIDKETGIEYIVKDETAREIAENAIIGGVNNIGKNYDKTITYIVGDCCIHDNVLYICIEGTNPGASATKYDENTIYEVGDYCLYEEVAYICIEALEEAGTFDISKWEVISTIEEWDETKWKATTITEILGQQNTNFQGAANVIRDAISSLGIEVPDGASLQDIAELITNSNIIVINSSIEILNNSTISGGWSSSNKLSLAGPTKSGTITSNSINSITLDKISSISATFSPFFTYPAECSTSFSLRVTDLSGDIVAQASSSAKTQTTLTVDTSSLTGSYYIQYYIYVYRTHADSGTPSSVVEGNQINSIYLKP